MKKLIIAIALIFGSLSVFGQVTETQYQNSIDNTFSGRGTSKVNLIALFEDTKDLMFQYKGYYSTLGLLQADFPTGEDGDFAQVAGDLYTWKAAAWTLVSGGGGGETNTASNTNVTGVGVWDNKSGVDLEFRGIVDDGASSIDVNLDDPNNEIEIGIADNGVQLVNMADNSVQAAEIVDGSVGAPEIGTDAVNSDEIAAGAVNTDELADNSVTLIKMADNAVGTNEIVDDAVSNADLANMAAWTLKMRPDPAVGDPQDIKISALTEELAPAAGDFVIIERAEGDLVRSDVGNLPGGGASVTNGANINTQGVGVFDGLNGTVLEFKGIDNVDNTLDIIDVASSNTIRISIGANAITSPLIDNASVENIDLASVPGSTIKGRDDATSGFVEDLTISAITEDITPSAGDTFLIEDGATGELRSVDFSNLPGSGGGEINDGANIGTGGVGPFDGKVGTQLQFRNIQSGSTSTIQVIDDSANDEIDLNIIAGSISNTYLADNAVTSVKVSDGSLTGADIADGTIAGADIGSNQVSNSNLLNTGEYTWKVRANSGTGSYQDLRIDQLSEELTPASGDKLVISDGVTNQVRYVDWNQVGAGGSGETNQGVNVNVAGVGVYDGKSGTDLNFRGILGSSHIDVTLDDVNNEIELSIINGSITTTELGTGSVGTDEIQSNAVSNFDAADMSAWTLKGRAIGTAGDPQDFKISTLSQELSPAAGDFILLELADGSFAYTDIDDLPGSGGEVNTLTNVGVSGVSIVSGKVGVDLQTNSILGNAQIGVNLDDPNNEVELSINANSLSSTEIGTDAIGADELADNSVSTANIVTGGVNADDLQSNSVGSSEIQTGAVGSDEIATDAVGSDEILTGAVTSSELATNAVGNVDMADNAVGSAEVIDNSLTSDDLGIGSVTSSEIASNAVNTNEIASNAATNSKLADMSAYTIKMRDDIASGDPEDVKISQLSEETNPESGDWIMIELTTGELRRVDIDNFTAYGAWQDVTISHADWTEDANKPIRYRLVQVDGEDWLEITGEMTFDGAGNGIDIFTLAVGFRPTFERWALAFVPDATGADHQVAMRIETNGNVSAQRVDNQDGNDELVWQSVRIPLF
jgi:hypothetical protein